MGQGDEYFDQGLDQGWLQKNRNGTRRDRTISKLDTTLSLCPSVKNISRTKSGELRRLFPDLLKVFEAKGEITEKEFDDMNIKKFEDIDGEGERNKKDKNERVLHQQRAVLLTKDASINRRLEYKRTQLDKEIKKLNAPSGEEKKVNAEIRSLLNKMVKMIDEKIQQENKSSKELEKKRLRDEKAARRKLDKEEREKKENFQKISISMIFRCQHQTVRMTSPYRCYVKNKCPLFD